MANSNRRNAGRKPAVFSERKHAAGVTAEFPLHIHKSGRWAKKVRGKRHYFGKVADDPQGQAALNLWLEQKDDLLAGRTPRSKDGLSVLELCTQFLLAKQKLSESGDISPRTFSDHKAICKRIVSHFGATRLVDDLRVEDFDDLRSAFAKEGGVHHLSNHVQRTRVVFKYAYDAGLIERPVRYGPSFKKPSKRIMRLAKAANGEKMFEAADIGKLLDLADEQMTAMIYLGLNCGFGNSDVGTLPLSALDLDKGWVKHPRPKTGIERRVPLWPETVQALKAAIAKRPQPKHEDAENCVFVTRYGASWAKETVDNPVTKEFRKVLESAKLHRPGLGFYALRHTFETVAGGCRDQVAVNAVMGHVDPSMAAEYRERIEDDRLHAAVDHVRTWLLAGIKPKTPARKRPQAS